VTRAPAPRWLAPALLVAVALIAYHNSLSGPFVFDDLDSIAGNPRIRRLWPLADVLRGTPRPFATLTFALNYALGGLDVRGYHVVNLAIHVLAASPSARSCAAPSRPRAAAGSIAARRTGWRWRPLRCGPRTR
jgi:hypothetical protein